MGREAGGDRRHGHQRRPGGRPRLPHRRQGPDLHHRLLHRRPADHRRDQHGQDPQEHRGQEHGQHAHLHLRRRRRRQRHVARRLADKTRAVATYVRPAEDIEAKVSGLYSKISNPVLTNLKLSATNDISFNEIYPPQLPDLFHGSQLVVLGRYSGKGAVRDQADRQGRQGDEGVRLRGDVPGQDERRPGLRRGVVGAAQGRLHARPDPGQRREEGTGGGGDGAGQEVRHHHAVHQLPDRAGRRRAGGAGQGGGRQAECAFSTAPAAPPALVPAGGAARIWRRQADSVEEFAKRNQQKPGDLA